MTVFGEGIFENMLGILFDRLSVFFSLKKCLISLFGLLASFAFSFFSLYSKLSLFGFKHSEQPTVEY